MDLFSNLALQSIKLRHESISFIILIFIFPGCRLWANDIVADQYNYQSHLTFLLEKPDDGGLRACGSYVSGVFLAALSMLRESAAICPWEIWCSREEARTSGTGNNTRHFPLSAA